MTVATGEQQQQQQNNQQQQQNNQQQQQQQQQNNQQQQQQQNNQQQQQQKPFYDGMGFDADTVKLIEDRKIADLPTLAKSWLNADRMATSRNVIELPDPNDLANWKGWEKVGWQADPAKYVIGDPPKVGEGIVIDKGLQQVVAKSAHEARVPLPAMQKVYNDVFGYFEKLISDAAAKGAKEEADLKNALGLKWGVDAEKKTDIAQRAMRFLKIGGDNTKLIGDMMGQPALVEAFYKIGAEFIGEQKLVDGGPGGDRLPNTVEALQAERRRLEADPKFTAALNNPRDPQRADYLAQRQAILDKIAKLMPAA